MIDISQTESNVVNILKKKYRLKIENACFSEGWIPNYVLLDRTRNIHSYFVICNVDNEIITSRYFRSQEEIGHALLCLSRIQYSELDRPLFLVLYEGDNSDIYAIQISEVREIFLQGSYSLQSILDLKFKFELILPTIKKEL